MATDSHQQLVDLAADFQHQHVEINAPSMGGHQAPQITITVGLQVPELGLELPFSAIGSGYADNEK